jgi:hypothetical protein
LFEFRAFHWMFGLSMKIISLLALAVLSSTALAEQPQRTEAPARIDVQQLTKQAAVMDNVVVPLPSEIFQILDKLGRPVWSDVLRPVKARPTGESEQIALLLGTVIAEGFIAVEAENAADVKNIGNSVRNLAKAMGVEKAVIKRANAIIEAADKKAWPQVRKELDGALSDVKVAMAELKSEPLSQLVSLGGWLRGTEALTQVVMRDYTKDRAGLLHQPVLVDSFDQRINGMDKRMKDNPLVAKIRAALAEIRPLMGTDDSNISEKTVKEIGALTERVVQAINAKANQ